MSNGNEEKMIEQEKRLKEKMSKIKHALIVMSGKGGVGKTSVAVNMACALAKFGKEIAILDTDIHGPNIAKMLGIEGQRMDQSATEIEPVPVYPNLKAVSLALLGYPVDQPIIWRGPMKYSAIRQFLSDVNWGELDYLIIDSPPGTGDEPLTVCQLIPQITGAVIVSTPQDVAILDARKSILFARELGIPVIGLIENMSGFICPHCRHEIDIFKKGGGEKTAKEMNVPFLGRIPFAEEIVSLCDAGTPFVQGSGHSLSAQAMRDIVRKIEGVLINDSEKL
ncbi:MAG: Mrp/NBP35 family ATP-binding protein [Candidatus Omnitrophota bacterium]